MIRYSLFTTCVFVISLNICVLGIQLEKDVEDLFGISSIDRLKTESESISNLKDEKVFQENGKTCTSDSDCFYGGNCTGSGTCSCPKGTNGTLCENVIQCLKHPEMCGNGTEAKCDFDVKSKIILCRCHEKGKLYNHFAERCAKPCEVLIDGETQTEDCGLYGRCVNQFCWCVNGVSGDFCEKIEKCDEMDCGSDPSTNCTLGIDGPYCKCSQPYQVFDEKDKICKGEPCQKSECMYGGTCTADGTCSCPAGTTGPLCQDVIECLENPYMCGNGTDVKCAFNVFDRVAHCSCDDKKKAFDDSAEKCAAPCQLYINHKIVVKDCGEYGRCSNSFCWCVPGVSGDRCEIIDQCASGEVDCSSEPLANCTLGMNGAYCKCHKAYQIFDKNDKMCKGEPCKSNTDCQYGGNCTEDETCFCRNGVGGPFCEQVYECEKNPEMCGNGTDVKCTFDIKRNKAKCECDDDEKGFDVIEKKCRKYCEDNKCGIFGKCERRNFCRCLDGVIGDACETIEKCIDMGCIDETNCTLGSDGEARCVSSDPLLGFDYETKTLKACECGESSKGCEFRGGEKKCECALNYFQKEEKCEACNCGEISTGCELRKGKKECFCPLNYTTVGGTCQKCSCGVGSYHCQTKDDRVNCVCYEPYKQRKDKCEFCDCGVHDGECSFDDAGKKQCICKSGFKMLEETGFCTQVCNDTHKCQNGGLCVEELCKCREDYAGAWCETPKWCLHNRCGHHFNQEHVECVWDSKKKEGRCQCQDPKSFYGDDRTCDKCDCGDFGHCILTERGEKVCICDEGYADYMLSCKKCDCGPDSINCTFQQFGKELCHCKENYQQKVEGDDALCVRCDCGQHGTCRFSEDEKAEKICDCKEDYKVFHGACEECICGPHGFCSFDSNGQKVCTCDFGYSVRSGRCESCDCEPPKMRGIGTVCLFGNSGKECHCPHGFESSKNDFCKDINECLNGTACPVNTDCQNMPGSYSCHCKKGFKPINALLDPKETGCTDINECSGHPCTDSNSECVNTPGSYDCKCKDGYYATSSTSGPYYNPKYVTCNKKETQWQDASIALGVILSLGILGVCGYIFYLKKGCRR